MKKKGGVCILRECIAHFVLYCFSSFYVEPFRTPSLISVYSDVSVFLKSKHYHISCYFLRSTASFNLFAFRCFSPRRDKSEGVNISVYFRFLALAPGMFST
jgi:hypothetical protein